MNEILLGSPFSPRPVLRPADQVRLAILEAIISGQLKPGDRMPSEPEQARGFRVSRSVVREALRSLAELGLISVVRGRGGGSYVNRLDVGPVERNLREAMDLLLHFRGISVAELLEARRAIEGVCASLAAARRTNEDAAGIASIVEQVGDASLSDESWLDLDIRFHRAVAWSAHNRALIVPLSAFHGVVQPRLNQAILPMLSRSLVNQQHGAICAAIEACHPTRAQDAVQRHLDHLEELYERAGLLGSPRERDTTTPGLIQDQRLT